MKSLHALSLLLLFLLCISCVKEPAAPKQNPVKTDMSELVVPATFTWSGVNRTDLTVNVVNGQGTASNQLDGQPLDLLDADGNRISRTVIDDASAQFTVSFASGVSQLFVSLPVTQTSVAVNLNSTTLNFPVPANAAALFAAQPDSDADGMPDLWDEYPNDPEAAFSYDFPALAGSNYSNLRAGSLPETGNLRATDGGAGYYFQIFEDLWPKQGDYDLNDLILMTRIRLTKNSQNYIIGGSVRSRIWAVGASTALPHGFGWEFLKRENSKNLSYLKPDAVKLVVEPKNAEIADLTGPARQDSEVENGIIMFDDVLKTIDPYYNNVGGEWGVEGIPQTCYFEFAVNVAEKVKNIELLAYMYNTHDRTLSIRTFGAPPAENVNPGRFRIHDDASASPIGWNREPGTSFTFPLTGENAFYRTHKNLPWAVEFIANTYRIPIEETSILEAYPEFQKWAESGGTAAKNWFKHPNTDLTLEVPK